MRDDDPQLRLVRRVVVGAAVGFAIVAAGTLLLTLAAVSAADDTAGTTAAAAALVLGWSALGAGPVVGLRLGGVAWRRALWAAPILPLGVVVAALVG